MHCEQEEGGCLNGQKVVTTGVGGCSSWHKVNQVAGRCLRGLCVHVLYISKRLTSAGCTFGLRSPSLSREAVLHKQM